MSCKFLEQVFDKRFYQHPLSISIQQSIHLFTHHVLMQILCVNKALLKTYQQGNIFKYQKNIKLFAM